MELTRQQFIDRLTEVLNKSFPEEQSGFQLSSDDVDAVNEVLTDVCHNTSSDIGGRSPYEE
jgi:hypothetical protein